MPVSESLRLLSDAASSELGDVVLTSVAWPALAQAVRCEVTLLFADLSGYTALNEERDPEEVAAAIGAVKRRALHVVRAHGGVVNQFVGDEVLAFFGFATDKDEAPRRAVEAALELHAQLRSGLCAAGLVSAPTLHLHTGIDAGLVLLRTDDVRNGLFELTGSAVNRAARLRSAAGRDEILVSQRVHARIAPFFYTEQLCERRFKGIAERSSPYLVVAAREAEPLGPRPTQQLQSTRSELSDLLRFWSLHCGRRGAAMFVRGVSGSGKTRLLSRFGAQVQREGAGVWHLRCHVEECVPFSALSPLTAAVPHACGVSVEELADLLLEQLGRTPGPQLLLIDDVQWLDASSRAVLSRMSDRLFAQGHCCVCAVCDDERGRESLERLSSMLPDGQSVLQLGPLTALDAEDLIVEYLGLRQLRGSESVEQLRVLAEGTPLGLVALLELVLEHKLLHSRAGTWQIDVARLIALKRSASAPKLIERRLHQLPAETICALRALAVLRGSRDLAMLGAIAGLDAERFDAALDDACMARLVEIDLEGGYRYVHGSIEDAVLAGLSEEERCAWHQRVVMLMSEHPAADPLFSFELARHSVAGTLEQDPRGSFERLYHAAHLALAACDDALALSFLKDAERAATRARLQPTAAFYAELAETSLRTGELELAFRSFETALERADHGIDRAHYLGRMAWIKHYNAEGEASLRLLGDALRQAGRGVPRSSVRPLARALVSRVSRMLGPAQPSAGSTREAAIRCELFLEAARIWRENGQPLQALTAAVMLSTAAVDLPEGRVRVRAQATVAFFLQAVGAQRLSHKLFESAWSSAQRLEDPVAIAFCHQCASVLAGWCGKWEDSEREAKACAIEHGQYMELGELCSVCLGASMFESCRGREVQALNWLEHAVDRALQLGHAPAMFELIEAATCAALVSAGRADEVPGLRRRLERVQHAPLGNEGIYKQLWFQQRLLGLLASGSAPGEIEALLAEFSALKLNPRRVHLTLVCFYLQVAHLRADQCLHASPSERAALLSSFSRALADVEACSRLPVIAAHAAVLRASHAWLCAREHKSERLLSQAETLARREFAPWVSYAVARLRAHMLLAAGKHEAAQEQAKLALFYAQKYGQHARARCICEEFLLVP